MKRESDRANFSEFRYIQGEISNHIKYYNWDNGWYEIIGAVA